MKYVKWGVVLVSVSSKPLEVQVGNNKKRNKGNVGECI